MQSEEISLKIQTLETQYQLNIKRSSLISELKEKISEVKIQHNKIDNKCASSKHTITFPGKKITKFRKN